MTITHISTLLSQLRVIEQAGGMPARAMRHVQKAAERLERKLAALAAA